MPDFDRLYTIPSAGGRSSAMEGLRAYAAGIVFLLHLAASFCHTRLGINIEKLTASELFAQNPLLLPLFWLFRSHYGVDIFFLMSGYLIAGLVAKRDFNYARFMLHRVFRIYPALLASLGLFIVYALIFKTRGIWLSKILGNVFLLNGVFGLDFQEINTVTWSIFFEFAFYIAFPIAFALGGRRRARTFAIFTAAVLPLSLIDPNYIRFLMFLGGAFLKLTPREDLDRWRARIGEGTVIALYLASTTLYLFEKNWVLFVPLYLVPATLFVDRALHAPGRLQAILSNRWLRYFGNISYSFYLLHLLGLGLAGAVIIALDIRSDALYFVLYLTLSFAFSVALSTASFVWIEKKYFVHKSAIEETYDSVRVAVKTRIFGALRA